MAACIHGTLIGDGFSPCTDCLIEREELAAKCYVGLIACSEVQGTFAEIAERAFDAADAFIKVRDAERLT